MPNLKQDRFEDSIILESNLSIFLGDDEMKVTIDNMTGRCNTLSDIGYSGTDTDFEVRNVLYALIYDRLDLLTPKQRIIAELRYLHNKTYSEIGETIGLTSKSTINHHMDKIKEVLRLQ